MNSLADHLLCPGLQTRPAIPQGELVGEVGLHSLCEAAVLQALPGKFRELGQGAVLRLGLYPIRQEDMPHQQST